MGYCNIFQQLEFCPHCTSCTHSHDLQRDNLQAVAGSKCEAASHVVPSVYFKALLLHGSLPEDEQDVSLSLDHGSAEQQVVVIIFPSLFSFFLNPLF